MNFVCTSRARGFDLSSVLLFATDEETRDLAHGLGLNVFFDEKVGPVGSLSCAEFSLSLSLSLV
jgi:hypothetical protein